jgi:DNA-binding NtrC family response regulator
MHELMVADTTAPADDTQDIAGSRGLAARWIFPQADGSGEVTLLGGGRVLLGRDDDCDARLPGSETSRRHAEIRREGPLLVIRDLESRNGTFVNGQRITTAPLTAGDLIRLGEWIAAIVPIASTSTTATTSTSATTSMYGSFAAGLYAGPALQEALGLARRAAPSLLPIVVEGETGTGKEGLCRALHTWSGRPGPFLAVNCGALPEALAEGELFGYRKGAFTGAERANLGHFRAADGGTLLLDEITDLPAPLQTKLLRALEQREVLPLGESAPVPVDVRVIAAAQESLPAAINDRRFRADLYARLNGLTIRLPPLRERVAEIPFLFMRLLADHSGGRPPRVEPRVIERLCLYDWPFNVRELDLLVRRLLVLDTEGTIRRSHLPEALRPAGAGAAAAAAGAAEPAAAVAEPRRPRGTAERQARDEQDLAALIAALRMERGNVARAAAAAGLTRARAYRLMEQRPDVDLDQLRES